MTNPSPIHLLADPQPEVAVAVTVVPRPLTEDEVLRVKCLRKFFTEVRSAVTRMVPKTEPRQCCHQEYTLWKLDQAERAAVMGLEEAMTGAPGLGESGR